VQCWLERTMLHLQKVVRGSLNMLAYLMPMSRAVEKRPEDEHIQGALENRHALL